MGVATAAIVGAAVVGAGASIYGANKAAGAAADSANAMNAASEDWQRRNSAQRKEAANAYDAYSPAQASTIEKAIASQERNVQRQETLVRSIDPSLIEAGKQMNSILQGQSAPVLQNIKDQRQIQRQGLLDTLRQQYGPGAETSSAGINAIQKFDAETANVLSGAQSDYLSKVSGIALNGAGTLGASLGAENSRLTDIANQYGNIGKAKADILSGNTAGSNAASAAQVQTAAATGVPGALQGQMISSVGQGLSQAVGAYASYAGRQQTPTLQDSVASPSTGVGTYRMPSSSNGYANSFGGDTLASRLGQTG